MSQTGGSNGAVLEAGTDFHLPDEILSVMPTDPYQQLDLARKITSLAIASRVSNLESEVSRTRQKLHDKDRTISDLEDRVAQAQRALLDSDSKLKLSLDDNVKLANERDSLAMTVKKLSRDLAKLETFKRQLMQSLNDDIPSHGGTVEIGTCDQSVPRVQIDKEEGLNGHASQHSFFRSTSTGDSIDEASKVAGQRFSITPYITPRLTPTGTPKVISTSVSPRGYSAAGSPQKTYGRTTPTKPHFEEKNVLSSWYTSSQQSSAANSPPRMRSMPEQQSPAYFCHLYKQHIKFELENDLGRTPRIDGKEFFRQARSRLSYEQFSAFLANIKELNAHKQTREETLRRAEEIFGAENKDLYLSFQGLLNRNMH